MGRLSQCWQRGPPDALLAARWKLLQLRVARGVGMLVPDTIVTTDRNDLEAFRRVGRTVIKAIQDARIIGESQERYGYTTELQPTDSLEGISLAPIMVQRLVEKVADVRITAIGRELFGVRITTPTAGPLDFRAVDISESSFEPTVVADALGARCLRFLDAYGLRFGAFDFAEDRDGRLWFLECNASGQWAWLERQTGLPMTAALIDELLSSPT